MIRKILKRKLVRLQRKVSEVGDDALLVVACIAFGYLDGLEAKRLASASRETLIRDLQRACDALRGIDLLVQRARVDGGYAVAIAALDKLIVEGLRPAPRTARLEDLIGGAYIASTLGSQGRGT